MNCYCHSSLCLLFREGQTYCTSPSRQACGCHCFQQQKRSTGAWGIYVCVCTALFFPRLHCQNPCCCCPTTGLVHGPMLLLPHHRAWFTPTYLPLTSTAPEFPPHCKIPALSDNSHPPTLLSPELKSYLRLQPMAQVCSRSSSLPAPNLHLQPSAAHSSPGIFLFHSLNEHLIFLTNVPNVIASPCVQP